MFVRVNLPIRNMSLHKLPGSDKDCCYTCNVVSLDLPLYFIYALKYTHQLKSDSNIDDRTVAFVVSCLF